MLVYLKQPMGYTSLDSYRIYGKRYAYGSFGATNIPISLYSKYKDILECSDYPQEWLEKKFKGQFPKHPLNMPSLYYLDIKVLMQIANSVGIKYIKTRRVTVVQKRTLCRTIRKVIERI